jgi:hypothetical protein
MHRSQFCNRSRDRAPLKDREVSHKPGGREDGWRPLVILTRILSLDVFEPTCCTALGINMSAHKNNRTPRN